MGCTLPEPKSTHVVPLAGAQEQTSTTHSKVSSGSALLLHESRHKSSGLNLVGGFAGLMGFPRFSSLSVDGAVGELVLLGIVNSPISSNAASRPVQLHECYDPGEVGEWDKTRFQKVRELMNAPRNHGRVDLMMDTVSQELVAVKKMPNLWVGACHEDFLAKYPFESELPWQDFGCTRYLAAAGYAEVLNLRGIYRDAKFTYVVSDFATVGDLCSWRSFAMHLTGAEAEFSLKPLAIQICEAVRDLHDLNIIHRDLSLENILLCEGREPEEGLEVKLIDFAMASFQRWGRPGVAGKLVYLAPEVHSMKGTCDGFLLDAFAVGIILFVLLTGEYPWRSTKPGACFGYELFRVRGIRAILQGLSHDHSIASEPLICVLQGLLTPDPAKRLTLGERGFGSDRRTVWDEPWMQDDD